MALRYLLDEHLRGALWQAIQHHNAAGANSVDAVRVGDFQDLPLGTADPDILLWAARAGRILVSRDKKSLPKHLANHLQRGHHSPGIFIIRQHFTLAQIVAYLARAASTTSPLAWQDRIAFVP
jgi:hypothetical protein